MGDPKKQRKKYRRPFKLWQKEIIEEQRKILKEYGLKNKKEIWRAESLLKRFREQARKLIASESEQAKKETEELIKKLVKSNLINPNARLEDILTITLKDILNRRLQTLVFKKNFAKTPKQARQFITHKHVSIGDKKINVPSYLVSVEEENKILFSNNSPFFSESHPERAKEKSKKGKIKVVKEEEKKIEEKPKVRKRRNKEE